MITATLPDMKNFARVFVLSFALVFSVGETNASTFSPTPEEADLVAQNQQRPTLDLSALTPRTESGRTFFEIDDMRYPMETIQLNNAFTGDRWPNGVLYYQFDPAVTATNRTAWRMAAATWNAVTTVSFREGTGDGAYVWVQNSTANNSYVGLVGGRQVMNIHDWTYRYIIAHEIGHALGLIHEHSRSNRNSYVTILAANIQPGMQADFAEESGSVQYGPYDFDSVMHYRRNAFSSNGQNTIQPKPAYSRYLNTMGQLTHLSMQDISGMVRRYPIAGDNFADGPSLPDGLMGSVNGSNSRATSELGEPAHAGVGAFASVWYRWKAPASGAVTIDTIGSDFDTVLALYYGDSLGSLIPITSNNNVSSHLVQSRMTFAVAGGTDYKIAVDGYHGASGHFVLHWAVGLGRTDINHDGGTDILLQNNSTGQRIVWLTTGGGANPIHLDLPAVAREWNIVGSADFNGDDYTDIVFQNYGTRKVVVWYMLGSSQIGGAHLPDLPVNWSIATTGDFTGDGKPDLVLENVANGQHAVWLMNGVIRTSSVYLPTTAAEWKIVGAVDMNGDGKTDLVFQNYATQQAVVWYLNGTALAGSAHLPTPTAPWRISGAGDVDRNGNPDLIMQNISTGQRGLWLMNAIVRTSSVALPAASVQWDIRNR